MTMNPIPEYFGRDLVPEYCNGLESRAVYTAHSFFVESLPGCSNKSIPHLLLHVHAEETVPTF